MKIKDVRNCRMKKNSLILKEESNPRLDLTRREIFLENEGKCNVNLFVKEECS